MRFFPVKNKSGYSIKTIKKVLIEHSHCGKYWNVKPKYYPFKGTVEIYMGGNEHLIYDISTGVGRRIDLDGDGCSITHNFDFVIGPSKIEGQEGILTIIRIN